MTATITRNDMPTNVCREFLKDTSTQALTGEKAWAPPYDAFPSDYGCLRKISASLSGVNLRDP